MHLIHKKLLNQKIAAFEFPHSEKMENIKKFLEGWQKALKDSDLEKTKEKSVQGKFLNVFFEEILGYCDMTKGDEEWSLIQHPRIENDNKEPDGSLGWFTKDKKVTRAVIELKDARTQLDKKQHRGSEKLTPIEQAYLYATKYDGCNWIIVSNFKEIRLYNKQRTQEYYERFEVLDLSNEAEFKRFYYLLFKENLLSKDSESVIDVLVKDTSAAEQDITKKFYAEFKNIRLQLLDHLITHNSEIAKEVLLEKAQKLLDRFIFTLFCEDTSGLLPLNIVKNTYERALSSLSPSDERVWNEFKGLFFAIDKGNSRVKPPINAYNGGLFAHDDILDNLHIKDEFWDKLMVLANYDFETDLNVNILGHIFEQSISDLESIKESISLLTEDGNHLVTEDGKRIVIGEETKLIEKVGRRKKDGIFYTPEYITRYIVENTVGKYLEENPDRLRDMKILDPACGSGAFLNQAHSFLLNAYKQRFEDEALQNLSNKKKKDGIQSLFGANLVEQNKDILLNNLYGVDLNQESVEITKLALWLKTARKTEPLQNLDKNIKCGNSLIDDPDVAGNKAFNWNTEFKEIMDEGGFDVIIGNPPYVSFQHIDASDKLYYENNFHSSRGKYDLYVLFIEKALNLLKPKGYLSMILPNKFLRSIYGESIKRIILQNEIVSMDDFNDLPVFNDATTYPLILTLRKNTVTNNQFVYKKINNIDVPFVKPEKITVFQDNLREREWILEGKNKEQLIKKLHKNKVKLKDISKYITQGLRTGALKIYYGISEDTVEYTLIEKVYTGKNIKAYKSTVSEEDLMIIPYKAGKVIDLNNYPKARDYFEKNKSELLNRKNSGKYFKETGKVFYEFWDYNPQIKEARKIVFPDISTHNNFFLDEQGLHYLNTCYAILLKDANIAEAITILLNSKVVTYFIHSIAPSIRGGYYRYKTSYVEKVPLPELNSDVLYKFKDYYFQRNQLSQNKFNIEKLAGDLLNSEYRVLINNKNLNNFTYIGWNELIEIFTKKQIKLSLDQKEDLYKWFNRKKSELLDLDQKIKALDNQIDQEVYKLYGLTDDDVKIIEDSLKK